MSPHRNWRPGECRPNEPGLPGECRPIEPGVPGERRPNEPASPQRSGSASTRCRGPGSSGRAIEARPRWRAVGSLPGSVTGVDGAGVVSRCRAPSRAVSLGRSRPVRVRGAAGRSDSVPVTGDRFLCLRHRTGRGAPRLLLNGLILFHRPGSAGHPAAQPPSPWVAPAGKSPPRVTRPSPVGSGTRSSSAPGSRDPLSLNAFRCFGGDGCWSQWRREQVEKGRDRLVVGC